MKQKTNSDILLTMVQPGKNITIPKGIWGFTQINKKMHEQMKK